jgi:hypothetical protein
MKIKQTFVMLLALGLAAAVPGRSVMPAAYDTVFADEEFADGTEKFDSETVRAVGEGIISCMAGGEEYFLFSEDFCAGAGSSVNDWLALGAARLGITEDTGFYTEALTTAVQALYDNQNLSGVKATEWHRMSLTLLALGADPTDVEGIDLIADGTYNHGQFGSLGRQGVNGWCFALMSLDASREAVPDGADYTREDLISAILEGQLSNGAFALAGMGADVDLTAMVLQALAPYYTKTGSGMGEVSEETLNNVDEAVLKSLTWLSAVQRTDGAFEGLGTANAESTAQVLIALTSLGIDPQKDARFIKEDGSALDGLMLFQMPDGGFAHVLKEDGSQSQTNGLASAQSLCAIAALYRFMTGQGALYDFQGSTDEQPSEEETTEKDASETEQTTVSEQKATVQEDITQEEITQENISQEDIAQEDTEPETFEYTPDTSQELPGYLIYVIAAFVAVLGVVVYLVMKKIGKTEAE